MNARDLRVHFSDADLALVKHDAGTGFQALLDRLSREGLLTGCSRDARDRIASRAAALLVEAERPSPALHAASTSAVWDARARACADWLRHGRRLRSTGSLRDRTKRHSAPLDLLDGQAVSRALAVAMREILMPGLFKAQSKLKGEARVALTQERRGADAWERALRPLLGEFAWNAKNHGAAREDSVLEAVATAAVLTGQAKSSIADPIVQALGAAASTLLKRRSPEVSRQTEATRRLAAFFASGNALRVSMHHLSLEEARLLGAASVHAAFGRGRLHRRASAPPAWFSSELLPEAWRERYGHLAADEAAAELRRMAADVRTGDDDRALALASAQIADGHVGAGRMSFADALGFDPAPLRTAPLRPGRLFRAVPKGRQRARLLCRGKHGRLIRCRAVADVSGAFVGYLAFDPLSREFGGRPLFAAYGLDGRRAGYAWADEPIYGRAGRPFQPFMSVPESIPTSLTQK